MKKQLHVLALGWIGKALNPEEVIAISKIINAINLQNGISVDDVKAVQLVENEITTTNLVDFIGDLKELKSSVNIPKEIFATITYAADSIQDKLRLKNQNAETSTIFANIALFCATKPSYEVDQMLHNVKTIVKACDTYGARTLRLPTNFIKACKMTTKTIRTNE